MKHKSLKEEILQLIITFFVFVIIIIGSISIYKQYNLKVEEVKYNQVLTLKQVDEEIDKLLSHIEFLSTYISKNYEKESDLLKEIVDVNNDISSVLILDEKGIIKDFYTLSNLNIHLGFDYSKKEYFKKLKDNSSYWSNVFLSTLNGEPTISYSFKIKNKVVVIMIDLSELSTFLEGFKNRDGTHMIRLFDKNGVMIINPDAKAFVFQRFNAITTEVFTKLVNLNLPYIQVMFKSIKSGDNQLGAYSKVQKTDWIILARTSHGYILSSLTNILFSYIFIIFLLVIVSIYISFKISKNIFKSFDEIQSITSNIANGQYNIELKSLKYDEFDKLLKSFNKMRLEINKREEYLASSLNSFKTLFNSTLESIIISKNSHIIDVNDVTLKMFKIKSKDKIVGKNIFNFVTDDSKKMVLKNYNDDKSLPYEIELYRMDNSKIKVLASGQSLELKGELVRISALIDITELRDKDKLLFQQSKMAAMGEMIGNIAHQWRQPLNVISTCASSVKFEKEFDTLDDERLYDVMDIIVNNTQYLSKTIDDFRNFFQSDRNKERFVVKNTVEQALKLLDSMITSHVINIETNYMKKDFKYVGYANEFIQVMINLLNNSKDAFILNKIDKRYIKISEYVDEDKYYLEIKDNAGGIPKNIAEKVFEPYFTTKHKSQGTGIGLYMSHQIIVDHMKGTLSTKNIDMEINNKIYTGTCFTITFPLD